MPWRLMTGVVCAIGLLAVTGLDAAAQQRSANYD